MRAVERVALTGSSPRNRIWRGVLPALLALGLAASLYSAPDGDADPAALRFVDPADGTIIDRETGLRWQKCTLGQRFLGQLCGARAEALDWHAARQRCAALERDPAAAGLPASSRWRVPTRAELESLLVPRSDGGRPFLNLDYFAAADPLRYWSGDAWTDREGTTGVLINFLEGTVYGASVRDRHYVRCVLRSGRIPSPSL